MTSTSYHNHTLWSDGIDSLMEMVEEARRAGLEELGISDHFVLMPNGGRCTWAMRPDFLGEYVAQIRQAQESTPDLGIRLGLEVDYFPETVESVRQQLSCYAFDYLIGSVHFVNDFPVDTAPEPWAELSQEEVNQVWRDYWRNLCAAADAGLFDILGHFDLPKKFQHYPSQDLTREALAVLDAVAASGMAVEINGAGWDKPVGEAYPSLFYLREARRRSIPIILSADAHASHDVARNLARARTLALAAGYEGAVRFKNRERRTEKFPG